MPAADVDGPTARIVRLLQAVAEAEHQFSLKDISGRLDLAPSTTHRLLQQLAAAGLVERGEGQSYRVGRELFRISSLVLGKHDIRRLARPTLVALKEAWGETSVLCLYMPATRTGMAAEVLRTDHPLQYVIEPLMHQPLLWGSLGRAILAHLPEHEARAAMGAADRSPLSGRLAPPEAELEAELRRIRESGVAAYEDRERLDIAGVAAPVFGHGGGVLGSVGVGMPLARYEALDKAALAADVARRARELTRALRR